MVFGKIFGGNKQGESGAEEADIKNEAFELYPPRNPKGLNPKEIGEFAKRIAAFRQAHLNNEDPRLRGSLQVLDLETIALRFGRRWVSIKEKAFRHIEACIAKRLGPDDVYVCEDENRVILLMTGVERDEAEMRGSRIAFEITERLCGVIPGGAAVRYKTMLFDFDYGLDGITGLNELQSRIRAFGQSADSAEEKLFRDTLPDLRMLYSPTLDTKSGRIYIYHGCPKVEDESGHLLPTDVVCPSSVNGVFDAEIDKWCLEQGAGFLDPNVIAADASMIVVPVRYETIASMKLRDPYMALCRKLPAVSADQLVFEVIGMPASMPQARVRELLAYLNPFCNHLIARISHKVLYAEHLTNCSVSTLSFQLDEVDEDKEETPELLANIKAMASPLGMRVLLFEAWSVNLCKTAYKVGIDQFNGSAFMKAVAKPGPIIDTNPKPKKTAEENS